MYTNIESLCETLETNIMLLIPQYRKNFFLKLKMAIKVKINTSTLASHNIEGTVLYALKKTLYKNLPWKS